MSNPDLQVNTITTMCDMTYIISPLTHKNLITVTEIVRKSSCNYSYSSLVSMCRDKLYTTPPITRWIYVTVVTVETSQQGKTPPGSVYSYIQIRMARFLALWFVTVFSYFYHLI